MKWFEVVIGCDGYYSPNRFKTLEQAEAFVESLESDPQSDVHVSEGPYEVDTDDTFFYYDM